MSDGRFRNYIDREQLIDVAYDGAGTPSILPLPSYAPLQRYYDAIEDKLSGEYNTGEYSPEKGDARMMTAGYSKNADGYWEKDGNVVICDILGFGIFNDFGPILARQLDKPRHQVDLRQSARRRFTPDLW